MLNLRKSLRILNTRNYQSLISFSFSQNFSESSTSIDRNEVETFSKVNDWWDKYGSMRPLHAYNEARVQYILKNVARFGEKSHSNYISLKGYDILDVGSGGGILCESLARRGANVTGIDMTPEAVAIAEEHSKKDPSLKNNLKYLNIPVESLVKLGHVYDMVTNVEVIEHVNDAPNFAKSLGLVCKKNGLCFVSTINKTWNAYAVTILGAEYITRIVPRGTHHYEKFIDPKTLSKYLTDANFEVLDIKGFSYNPLNNTMNESSDLSVNYFITAKKL